MLETEPKVTPEVNLYYEVGQSIPFELSMDSDTNAMLYSGQTGHITTDTVGKTAFKILDFRPPNKIWIRGANDSGGDNALLMKQIVGIRFLLL